MRRLYFIALALTLLMSGAAFAGTYGAIDVTIVSSDTYTRGFYGDYDLRVWDTQPAGFDPAFDDAKGKWHEVFCIDPDSGFANHYTVADVEDGERVIWKGTQLAGIGATQEEIDAKISVAAGVIRSMISYAQTELDDLTYSNIDQFVFDPADYSGTPTQQNEAAKAAAQGNVDPTVVGLQGAIWQYLGIGSGGIGAIGDAIYNAVLPSAPGVEAWTDQADAYAIINETKQDFAILTLGDPQTEIPEPGSMVALCGLGLMLGGARYRRRRK